MIIVRYRNLTKLLSNQYIYIYIYIYIYMCVCMCVFMCVGPSYFYF